MAKRKYPIHHLHRIKIHHNRWLIWAIAYAVMVTIAIVGYVKFTDLKYDSELIAENAYQSWHSYDNDRLGFSLRYPGDWSIEANSDSSVSFTPSDSEDLGVTISAVSPSSENSVRKGLDISSEKSVVVGGVPGVKIRNDLGERHYENVVLVKNAGRLYVIRGTTSLVDRILQTIKFEN